MSHPSRRYAAQVAGVAAAYYVSAKLGLELAFESSSVTAVWAPTGIALAALVLGGPRLWPAVALGALLANLGTGVPLTGVLGITAGNTLEALAGAQLLWLARFRPSLDRVRDVVALAVLAGAVATTVSATVGVSSLLLTDGLPLEQADTVWRTWWLGDMGGVLIVATAIMVAVTHWPYREAPGRPLEGVAMLALLGAVAGIAFSSRAGLAYLVFPPLAWASLRFWQPGAAAASLLLAGIAVPLAQADVGPWSGNSPDERLLLAQTFTGVAALSSLILAAATSARRRTEDEVEHIAGTLQESLRPARLPELPGMDTAVDFRPAGKRHLVGGDFYDAFRNDDGSWVVVVGDVCGKGADAAAVTGLARYTLRAAALQERRPSRVLALLNDAILRQRPRADFCSVACVRLDLDGPGSVNVTVAAAGHPLPFVVRADGRVEQLGEYGTLLGVAADPSLVDRTSALGAADALVLYTDGLTDAYAPRRVVELPDLVSLLGGCAGRGANEIAKRVGDTLLDLDGVPLRDDVALLVLKYRGRERIELRLEPDINSVPVARSALAQLEHHMSPKRFDDLRLLVTELVSNSIRHGDRNRLTGVELSVHVQPDRIRVQVVDDGGGFEHAPRSHESDAASGWGLYLVEQVADRWGLDHAAGSRVWFELNR
jgi:integral membrane sensor domain MASE1/anti-sigma regulatory factor (Ser/Thr protein kinase)